MNIINSNGNKYVLNNGVSYNNTIVYGLGTGTYTLKNISQIHPMALLNYGVSNVTYTGDSNNKHTKIVNGNTYDFYYGDMNINVSGVFEGGISIYCYYHGYMGGNDLLIYSDNCIVPEPEPEPEPEQEQEKEKEKKKKKEKEK